MTDVLLEWLRSFGALSWFSGLMVASLFAAAACVFVPRTFLTLGVGGLYGMSVIPVIIVGATVGGTLAFLMARYFLADHVQRWIDRHPSMRVIADAVDEEGWRIVALLGVIWGLMAVSRSTRRVSLPPAPALAPAHRAA